MNQPKAEIQQKKIMLSVWWDYIGILHFELLPRNQMINSNGYVQQFAKLSDAVQEKSNWVKYQIIFSHPPYSSDIAPSDYHL